MTAKSVRKIDTFLYVVAVFVFVSYCLLRFRFFAEKGFLVLPVGTSEEKFYSREYARLLWEVRRQGRKDGKMQ